MTRINAATGETGDTGAMARLNRMLGLCAQHGASDLHLSPGLPPYLRVDGELIPLIVPPLHNGIENGNGNGSGTAVPEILTADEALAFARAILDNHAPSVDSFETRLAVKGSIDGALTAPDGSRFRFNLFMRQRQIGLVLRRLEDRFRSLKELGLPEALYDFCNLRDGLVMICGPTGAGKSTTLAALLDRINRTRASHVVTIEDPVEYVHKPIRSVISHRQVGIDAPSFNDALVASLRQDPDVVLLGEARDLETIRTAIVASETGHLVFATLHAGDCIGAVERVTAVFAAGEQEGIRRQLALVLRAVFAQHLLPALSATSGIAGGKSERVAASELLVVTSAVSNLVMQGKSAQIGSVMETGQASGMQTLDQDLARLWVGGRISEATAMAASRNPGALRDRAALIRKRARPAGAPTTVGERHR